MARSRRDAVPSWAPLAVQYADYALWQREVLGSEDDAASLISRQVEFWSRALAGLPDQLDVALRIVRGLRSRHSIVRAGLFVGDRCGPVHRWSRVMSRSRVEFDAVHGGACRPGGGVGSIVGYFEDITDRHTDCRSRRAERLDDLVGMFVNTLVLRTSRLMPALLVYVDLALSCRVRRILAGVCACGCAVRAFGGGAQSGSVARAYHPLFQVGLVVPELGGVDSSSLSGLTAFRCRVRESELSAKFDLQLDGRGVVPL